MKLAAFAALVAVAVPAAAFGAGQRFELPPWMERMMGKASPEMERMMETPEMRRMMDNQPPGMEKMMNAPRMQRMMGSGGDNG